MGAGLLGGEHQDAGQISAPYPTVNGITLEWPIEGDEDNDGAVNVRYRRVGAARWNEALMLKRVPAGNVAARGNARVRKREWRIDIAGSSF